MYAANLLPNFKTSKTTFRSSYQSNIGFQFKKKIEQENMSIKFNVYHTCQHYPDMNLFLSNKSYIFLHCRLLDRLIGFTFSYTFRVFKCGKSLFSPRTHTLG